MSNKNMDKCLKCDRYALGCDPLIMPDGKRLRQLQRDTTKRFCHYHMPKEEKVPVPACAMPVPPATSHIVDEMFCREIPCISRSDTPSIYVHEAAQVPFNQSRVTEVRWQLTEPAQRFLVFKETREHLNGMFHVANLVAFHPASGGRVFAVKYRTSHKSDPVWLWRDASRMVEVEKWARRQHHVNVAVWQWGLHEALLQKEAA